MKIHYLQPFALDKNIGRAYNEACEPIPDGDWICLRDGDSMFLRHDWGQQLHDIVSRHGDQYALFGCRTNRLRTDDQIYSRAFFDDPNVLHHKVIADNLAATRYADVTNFLHPLAGLLMLFPKTTWHRVRFKENRINLDAHFSNELRQQGYRIGLMEGVYCFHFYRFDKPDPCNYIKHLQ
jgi:hypothetical protein